MCWKAITFKRKRRWNKMLEAFDDLSTDEEKVKEEDDVLEEISAK